MRHHWTLQDDDGTTCRFRCISCGGVLATRTATPDVRSARAWTVGAAVTRLRKVDATPACEGRSKVKMTRVGRHVVKSRAA